MRILSVHLENFGSYETLDFDFKDQGLTLIQGSTGSGKSTFMDAVPWVLFGKTAKGGTVDEILSWSASGRTVGVIGLKHNNEVITIGRYRKPNDLIMRIDGEIYRGKDLNDTQRIINDTLGLNVDLYLSSSYFHEFSQTAQFFTTTAKNRRIICEQVVDLSLPTKLQENTSIELKSLKTKENEINLNIKEIQASVNSLKLMQTKEITRYDDWEKEHNFEINTLKKRLLDFEATKNKALKTTDGKCLACGQPTDKYHRTETHLNPYEKALELALQKTNPHTGAKKDYSDQIKENENLLSELNTAYKKWHESTTNLELLQEIISEFRSVLITNTILQIEQYTNSLLSDYFDGEFKVALDITVKDKLEVLITKDGNECSYTQLSKGQRQLLKLSFGIAVMKAVSNNSGVSCNCAFFDEALDGLDDTFKMKAVKLLEQMATEYESLFLVEHSETVKAMLPSKYNVQLINGKSHIEKI